MGEALPSNNVLTSPQVRISAKLQRHSEQYRLNVCRKNPAYILFFRATKWLIWPAER